jgi:hypothetical protein
MIWWPISNASCAKAGLSSSLRISGAPAGTVDDSCVDMMIVVKAIVVKMMVGKMRGVKKCPMSESRSKSSYGTVSYFYTCFLRNIIVRPTLSLLLKADVSFVLKEA